MPFNKVPTYLAVRCHNFYHYLQMVQQNTLHGNVARCEQWLDLGECSGIHHTILSNVFGSVFKITWLGGGNLTLWLNILSSQLTLLTPSLLQGLQPAGSHDPLIVFPASPQNLCSSWTAWNYGSLQTLLLYILSTSTPLLLWYSPGWQTPAIYHLHSKSWIRKNNKQLLLETYHL